MRRRCEYLCTQTSWSQSRSSVRASQPSHLCGVEISQSGARIYGRFVSQAVRWQHRWSFEREQADGVRRDSVCQKKSKAEGGAVQKTQKTHPREGAWHSLTRHVSPPPWCIRQVFPSGPMCLVTQNMGKPPPQPGRIACRAGVAVQQLHVEYGLSTYQPTDQLLSEAISQLPFRFPALLDP